MEGMRYVYLSYVYYARAPWTWWLDLNLKKKKGNNTLDECLNVSKSRWSIMIRTDV